MKINCAQCGKALEYPSGKHGNEVTVTCPDCLFSFKDHRKPLDIRDQVTLKKVRTLAWKECANFFGAQEDAKCSLHGKCIFYSGESEDCPYFYNCVLPIDPELQEEIVWEGDEEEGEEKAQIIPKRNFRGVRRRVRGGCPF